MRVKYQKRIAECGQFLLDNVKPNGGFADGEPTAFANDVPYTMPKREVASGGGKATPVDVHEPKARVVLGSEGHNIERIDRVRHGTRCEAEDIDALERHHIGLRGSRRVYAISRCWKLRAGHDR